MPTSSGELHAECSLYCRGRACQGQWFWLFLNPSVVRLSRHVLDVAAAEQHGAHACMNRLAVTEHLWQQHTALSTFLCGQPSQDLLPLPAPAGRQCWSMASTPCAMRRSVATCTSATASKPTTATLPLPCPPAASRPLRPLASRASPAGPTAARSVLAASSLEVKPPLPLETSPTQLPSPALHQFVVNPLPVIWECLATCSVLGTCLELLSWQPVLPDRAALSACA